MVDKTYWIDEVRFFLSSIQPSISARVINSFFFCEILLIFWVAAFKVHCHICFCRLKSWRSPLVIYLLVLQLLAAGVALFEINGNRFRLGQLQDPRWEHFLSVLEHIG